MAKKKGKEIKLKWASTVVNNITSVSLTVEGETIDVSDFDSGDWTEKLAGSKDWSIDLSVYNNPEDGSTQGTLETAMIDGDRKNTVSIGPESPATGDVVYTGDAILTSFGVDASGRDEPVESSYSLEGTGAVTRNVTT